MAAPSDFSEQEMNGARLAGSDLPNLIGPGAFLNGADLRGAQLQGADLTHTKGLTKRILTRPA